MHFPISSRIHFDLCQDRWPRIQSIKRLKSVLVLSSRIELLSIREINALVKILGALQFFRILMLIVFGKKWCSQEHQQGCLNSEYFALKSKTSCTFHARLLTLQNCLFIPFSKGSHWPKLSFLGKKKSHFDQLSQKYN